MNTTMKKTDAEKQLIKKNNQQLIEITPRKAHKLVSTGIWDLKTFLAWCRAVEADCVEKTREELMSSW